MRSLITLMLVVPIAPLLISACGGSSSSNSSGGLTDPVQTPDPDPAPINTEPFPNDGNSLSILSTTLLDASDSRFNSAYELIRDIYGEDAIESPDLYPADKNHTDEVHIELVQNAIPAYFLFSVHRDLDWDRDKFPEVNDRQRNEIKIYDGSNDSMKGYQGDTFIYEWSFYIEQGMTISNNFTHLFQLVSKADLGSGPILQLSAAKDNDVDQLEIRYRNYQDGELVEDSDLAVTAQWSSLQDQWLDVKVVVTFAEMGAVLFIVENEQGEVLRYANANINLWDTDYEYIRPKWGIYRSLLDIDELREEEDRVRYSSFRISEAI